MKKRKNKHKSVITRRIFKSIRKIGACLLILIFLSSLMVMRETNSRFSDEEKSGKNILTATSLDGSASYVELFNVTGMVPGSHPDQSLIFSNEGGSDFKYEIKYKNIGGDSEFCDALLLTAERNGTKVYDKQLLKDFDLADFSGNSFSIAVFGNDNWNFVLELPDEAGNNLERKICQFNFDFSAWQNNFADNSQGFTDEETEGINIVRTGSWIDSGDVVINEIMWMGSGGHPSKDLDDKNIKDSTLIDIVETKKSEEEENLEVLLGETGQMLGGQDANVPADGESPSVVPTSTEENILSGAEIDTPDAETAKNSEEEPVPEEKTEEIPADEPKKAPSY